MTQAGCWAWIEEHAQLTPELSVRESGLCPRCDIDAQRFPTNNSHTPNRGGGGEVSTSWAPAIDQRFKYNELQYLPLRRCTSRDDENPALPPPQEEHQTVSRRWDLVPGMVPLLPVRPVAAISKHRDCLFRSFRLFRAYFVLISFRVAFCFFPTFLTYYM